MEDIKEGRPFAGGEGQWLNSVLRAAKINRNTISLTNVMGCCPPDNTDPLGPDWHYTDRYTARQAVQYCTEHHLNPTLDIGWSKIIALGDTALAAATPRQGLATWRGSPLPRKGHMSDGVKVMPTFHPEYLMRDAGQFDTVVRDVRKPLTVPKENYNLYPSLEEVRAFTDKTFSFDFEWDREGNITLCGLSSRYYECLVVTFIEPYISALKDIFERAECLIGHNIVGADTRYFERLGWRVTAKLLDTMLMHHLVQPDSRHGLAYVASVLTNKPFWKGIGEEQEDDNGNFTGGGAQWKTWNSPEAIPRELGGYGGCRDADEAFRLYNARDTDGALQCVGILQNSLRKFGLEHIYENVSSPISWLCRDMADEGLRVDNTRVANIREECESEIARLEEQLPPGLAPYEEDCTVQQPAPPNTYKSKSKTCKGTKKSKTSHDPYTLTFDQPGTLACARCGALVESGPMQLMKVVRVPAKRRVVPWNSNDKVLEYANNKGVELSLKTRSGKFAADKKARKIWGRTHTEFTLVDHLKKLNTQRNSFAKPGLKYVDRVYFNILPHGTSEGRLSSSGRRRNAIVLDPRTKSPILENGEIVTISDPNIQNQPKSIRKIFLADYDDWGILNLDIVQGENMLTAWLARDYERLERLNTPGYDEHADLAARCFGLPFDMVKKGGPKEFLRQVGKKINHARNYGMGWRKMQMELALEGYTYQANDVKDMIEEWKRMNKRTAQWQEETIELAKRQSWLVNPFGRRRWFSGRDFANKALAFIPASTLADCVLRMMIGIHADKFPRECMNLRLGRTTTLPSPWRLFNQVHDSLGLMGPHANHLDVAYRVAAVMTQPWPELDGYALKVDTEYAPPGKSWGDVKGLKL